MRLVYSVILMVLLPALMLRLLWRSRRAPAYRQRLGERFGVVPAAVREAASQGPLLWVHAVSLGETVAARPLIEHLLGAWPQHRVLVTTTTPTGSEQVQRLFGERVLHCYLPWDTPGAVRRFLRSVQPQLLVLMETELWPNLLHYSAAMGCRTVLANARLSERSARGYARLPRFSAQLLGYLDAAACQAEADARRLIGLGLPPARAQVTGSIKFDLVLSDSLRARSRELRTEWQLAERFVLLAASTHRGEDEQVLAAFAELRALQPHALLVLVPRHPERFADMAALCSDAGWNVQRRSSDAPVLPEHDVLLGDTMGELLLLFGLADLAIIGGSLVPRGGHNPLEAAAWGVPVICGPHMFNFAAVAELLLAAGALRQLDTEGQLSDAVLTLAADATLRRHMGSAAQAVVARNRGARQRMAALLDQLIGGKRTPMSPIGRASTP
jgi:3-deoxy-D-manno-octulosonic-acid transferase